MKNEKEIGLRENKIIVFDDKKIRRVWDEEKEDWFFSVVDVIGVLTDSVDSRKYWNKLAQRLREEGCELVTICHRLKIESSDGKKYMTDCANKEGVFRIIQSITSKKAEPFKMWLAKVGSKRVDEIENPELAQERMKNLYEQKGYSKDWIDKRLRGIAIRQNLTDEWSERGVNEGREYAILTDEIARATFRIGIKEYKELKSLSNDKNQNLRDHMTDLELIFNMLGEKVATEITKERNSDGFDECLNSAKEGGEVAGNAREDAEKRIGKSIVSKENYLDDNNKKLIGDENE